MEVSWRMALLALFIIVTIVTNGYILQTRLDRIIELLEDLTKPRCKIKPPEVNVLFTDGTNYKAEKRYVESNCERDKED